MNMDIIIIDLLKMDIEGSECDVIEDMLKRKYPKIFDC